MTITEAQVKAARELLGWSQADLAAEVRVSTSAISKFEQGGPRPRLLALSAMRLALESAGVEFTNGENPGVRWRDFNYECPDLWDAIQLFLETPASPSDSTRSPTDG